MMIRDHRVKPEADLLCLLGRRARLRGVSEAQAQGKPQEKGRRCLLRETTDNLDSCSMQGAAQFCFQRKHQMKSKIIDV